MVAQHSKPKYQSLGQCFKNFFRNSTFFKVDEGTEDVALGMYEALVFIPSTIHTNKTPTQLLL